MFFSSESTFDEVRGIKITTDYADSTDYFSFFLRNLRNLRLFSNFIQL